MIADDLAILAVDDPVGKGMDLDWATRRLRVHRVFIIIEPHQQCLRYRRRQAWKPSNGHRWPISAGRSAASDTSQTVRSLSFGCAAHLACATQRSTSQAFSSSRSRNRSRGVKKRSRTSPTWF